MNSEWRMNGKSVELDENLLLNNNNKEPENKPINSIRLTEIIYLVSPASQPIGFGHICFINVFCSIFH